MLTKIKNLSNITKFLVCSILWIILHFTLVRFSPINNFFIATPALIIYYSLVYNMLEYFIKYTTQKYKNTKK